MAGISILIIHQTVFLVNKRCCTNLRGGFCAKSTKQRKMEVFVPCQFTWDGFYCNHKKVCTNNEFFDTICNVTFVKRTEA